VHNAQASVKRSPLFKQREVIALTLSQAGYIAARISIDFIHLSESTNRISCETLVQETLLLL